nr:conotoxin precursor Rimp01 [Conus judaeus]UMA83613.1 conotoxin precursor Rimp01 [Conus judaeus]UMA83947.1 conotoxin precursor Rimp01 [Conus judaeus]DAZ86592.1 TPA_inf: conotoxin precursor Rimp01 [Conus judaeus]DAZ86955.1 TPA_inf: conotoxin precursor Rimp01 [Conus judaeus]
MARLLSILLCIAVAVGLAAGIQYPTVRPIGPCSTNAISKTELYSNRYGRYVLHYSYCSCASGEVYFEAQDTTTSYTTVLYKIYACGAPTHSCSGETLPVTDPDDRPRKMQCTCEQYKYLLYPRLGWLVRCK